MNWKLQVLGSRAATILWTVRPWMRGNWRVILNVRGICSLFWSTFSNLSTFSFLPARSHLSSSIISRAFSSFFFSLRSRYCRREIIIVEAIAVWLFERLHIYIIGCNVMIETSDVHWQCRLTCIDDDSYRFNETAATMKQNLFNPLSFLYTCFQNTSAKGVAWISI